MAAASIKVAFRLTKDEYVEAYLSSLRKPRWPAVIGMAVLGAVAVFAGRTLGPAVVGIALWFASGGILYLDIVSPRIRAARAYRAWEVGDTEVLFTVHERGVSYSSERGNFEFFWPSFRSWKETSNVITLFDYNDGSCSITLPKRVLSSEQIETLRNWFAAIVTPNPQPNRIA